MKAEVIKNKDGQPYKTTDGKNLVDFTLEEGDVFIPSFTGNNAIIEKKQKGSEFSTWVIKAKVQDKNGKDIVKDGEKEIFIKLTPTQKNAIQKEIDKHTDINQYLWNCYSYISKKFKKQYLGVSIQKERIKAKEFEDFVKKE